MSCVVVDYACPDGAANWVVSNFPQVTVVRVSGDDKFSASRARNIGAKATRAPWLAFFDADILWSAKFSSEVIPKLLAGNFYRAEPFTLQTWGSIICNRHDFETIGGYDEAFTGWGGEDDDLIARLVMLGRTSSGFPATLIDEIPHDDDARVRFHGIKNRAVQHRINILYTQAKLDLMRLLGATLPLETRQALAHEVTRTIINATESKQAVATLEVNLPAQLVKPPPVNGLLEHWHLNRKLAYSIDIAARFIERI